MYFLSVVEYRNMLGHIVFLYMPPLRVRLHVHRLWNRQETRRVRRLRRQSFAFF